MHRNDFLAYEYPLTEYGVDLMAANTGNGKKECVPNRHTKKRLDEGVRVDSKCGDYFDIR